MFKPRTKKLELLSQIYPHRVKELEKIFNKTTSIYIDFANVYHWQDKLKWHIDLKRLKQLLDSFSNIKTVRLYNGLLKGDKKIYNRICKKVRLHNSFKTCKENETIYRC